MEQLFQKIQLAERTVREGLVIEAPDEDTEYFVAAFVIVAPEGPRVRGMLIEAFWLDSTGDPTPSYQMTMNITFVADRPVKIEVPDLSPSASPSQPTPTPSPTPSPTAGPSPSPVAIGAPGQGRRLGRRPARGACG